MRTDQIRARALTELARGLAAPPGRPLIKPTPENFIRRRFLTSRGTFPRETSALQIAPGREEKGRQNATKFAPKLASPR